MAIALGEIVTGKVFQGSNELLRIYRGTALIFDQVSTGGLAILVDANGVRLVDRAGAYLVEAPAFEAPPIVTDFLLTEDGDRLTLEDGTPIELTATIDGLAVAVDPDGAEWVCLVQDGATVKCRLSVLAEYING